MCENWSKNDSKLPLGGFLGPLLEALGAMWVPRGAPMLKNNEKWSICIAFGGPHFGTFLVIFRDFMLFGGCFLGVLVFEPFGDSIFTVLGIIFECFVDAFFVVFFLLGCDSKKCGLDSLFIVYKAHGHFLKNAKN